jgi:hypothetical protein
VHPPGVNGGRRSAERAEAATRARAAGRIAPCLLAALVLAAPARADVDIGDIGAAAIVSPAANALVAIRRSEPRSEVALSIGAVVTDQSAHDIDGFVVPARNGLARAALELQGSWAPARTWELFATFNGLAGRWFLVNGTDHHDLALGAATVGATWVPVSLSRGRLDGGVFLRVLLPTSQEIDDVHAWGLQPGLTLRGMAAPWLAWFGGASFRVSQTWGSVATPVGTRSANGFHTGASATAGLAFVPASWVRLVVQGTGSFPFDFGRTSFTPGFGVRLVQGAFAAEVGVGVPLGSFGPAVSGVGRVSFRLDDAGAAARPAGDGATSGTGR